MAKLLSILLQRSDPAYPWGFSVRGGVEEGTLLTIDHVQPDTMAAQYLAPGDTVLQIEKVDTRQLRQAQVQQHITRPSKSLDLLVLKASSVMTPSPTPPPRQSLGFGRDQRARKQFFWDRTISEEKDFCREGFTKLDTGADSPFKTRQPSMNYGRRCMSEEKSTPRLDDTYSSVFSDSEERHCVFDSSRLHSVWSPEPSSRGSQYWSRDVNNYERQGDMTFWEMSQGSHENTRNSYLNKKTNSNQSDMSRGYGSLTSEYSPTPKSSDESFNSSYMKKPSDFLGDHYRDLHGRVRLGSLPPTVNDDLSWTNRNLSSVSEFKKSTSISKKSYSSSEGAKSFETFEELNKTKETEKSSKTCRDGKEEIIEKTKQNNEYVVSNKEDVNGKPKQTKKVVNDFKTIERVVDGEKEFFNKSKEHKEEVTNSSTPVNFYDNVQEEGSKSVNTDWCRRVVNRAGGSATDNCDDSERSFSPLFNKSPDRRWATSTPVPEDDLVYRHQEPLQESYFEVDIRSPIESQHIYSTKEEILRFSGPNGTTERKITHYTESKITLRNNQSDKIPPHMYR